MIPKIVFSLVFMGEGALHKYLALFRVFEMDERFRGKSPFLASNGWSIRSSGTPDIQMETRRIYLRGGDHSCDNRQIFITITSAHETEVRTRLQEIVDALKEWADKCPDLSDDNPLFSCCPEVRDSLLIAKLNCDEDEGEDTDAPAPVFFDEFILPRIALG